MRWKGEIWDQATVLSRRVRPPWDMLQCLETLSIVSSEKVLLAAGGESPGMLCILRFTGKPPTAQNNLVPNVTSADLEKRLRPGTVQ